MTPLLKNGTKLFAQFQKHDLDPLSLETLDLKSLLTEMIGMSSKEDSSTMNSLPLIRSIPLKDLMLVKERLNFMERTSKASHLLNLLVELEMRLE